MAKLEIELAGPLTEREAEVVRQAVRSLVGSSLLREIAEDRPEAISDSRAARVREIAGGPDYTDQERQTLQMLTLLRSFERRRELLKDSITAPEAARLLGTSRQTPHDRVRGNTLLAVLDRGALRFPLWQFDPEGPDGVIAGLPPVLRALDVSPLARVSWLTRANAALERRTPLEALRQGETERVLDAARGVGDIVF